MGLKVMSEDELEAEAQEIQDDAEVERIFNDAKEKHHRLMTGIHEFIVFFINVKGVEGTLYRIQYIEWYAC